MSIQFGIDDSRYAVYDRMPYLQRHMMSLIPVKSEGLGTFAMDQYGRLYYAPAMFDEWSLKECSGGCLHELLHDVLNHCGRPRNCLGNTPHRNSLRSGTLPATW